MEKNAAILHPAFALAAWTFVVLLRLAYARLTSKLRPSDFRHGESSAVPSAVLIPNRNYMNLLELPVLFYVACILLYVAGTYPSAAPAIAWAYVALRILHSLIHLSYNNVMHRLAAFAVSNFVLVVLWVCAWRAI